MTGQGNDCYFGVTGSFSGFGTIVPKSEKYSSKAKKKLLESGTGATIGYKYYDFMEEATIEGWITNGLGSTGTVQPTTVLPGTTVTVTGTVNQMTGSWSLDDFQINGQVEDATSVTINLSRYAATPVV